jgi:hypothetical protein
VQVITGVLGSGKAIILNHIRTGNKGKKIVIDNEFEEIDVDSELVASSEALDVSPYVCVLGERPGGRAPFGRGAAYAWW